MSIMSEKKTVISLGKFSKFEIPLLFQGLDESFPRF